MTPRDLLRKLLESWVKSMLNIEENVCHVLSINSMLCCDISPSLTWFVLFIQMINAGYIRTNSVERIERKTQMDLDKESFGIQMSFSLHTTAKKPISFRTIGLYMGSGYSIPVCLSSMLITSQRSLEEGGFRSSLCFRPLPNQAKIQIRWSRAF